MTAPGPIQRGKIYKTRRELRLCDGPRSGRTIQVAANIWVTILGLITFPPDKRTYGIEVLYNGESWYIHDADCLNQWPKYLKLVNIEHERQTALSLERKQLQKP